MTWLSRILDRVADRIDPGTTPPLPGSGRGPWRPLPFDAQPVRLECHPVGYRPGMKCARCGSQDGYDLALRFVDAADLGPMADTFEYHWCRRCERGHALPGSP